MSILADTNVLLRRTQPCYPSHILDDIPVIRRHFEKVVILIVAVSLIPVVLQAIAARRQSTLQPQPQRD